MRVASTPDTLRLSQTQNQIVMEVRGRKERVKRALEEAEGQPRSPLAECSKKEKNPAPRAVGSLLDSV